MIKKVRFSMGFHLLGSKERACCITWSAVSPALTPSPPPVKICLVPVSFPSLDPFGVSATVSASLKSVHRVVF